MIPATKIIPAYTIDNVVSVADNKIIPPCVDVKAAPDAVCCAAGDGIYQREKLGGMPAYSGKGKII